MKMQTKSNVAPAEVAPNGEPQRRSPLEEMLEKYLVEIAADGKKALNFAPEDYDDLALIPLPVATKLIKALGSINVREYKRELVSKIERAETYGEIQAILEDEYIFNLTVRRIEQFDDASKEQRQSAQSAS